MMMLLEQVNKIEQICAKSLEFRKSNYDRYVKMNYTNPQAKHYNDYIIQLCKAKGVSERAVLRLLFN